MEHSARRQRSRLRRFGEGKEGCAIGLRAQGRRYTDCRVGGGQRSAGGRGWPGLPARADAVCRRMQTSSGPVTRQVRLLR